MWPFGASVSQLFSSQLSISSGAASQPPSTLAQIRPRATAPAFVPICGATAIPLLQGGTSVPTLWTILPGSLPHPSSGERSRTLRELQTSCMEVFQSQIAASPAWFSELQRRLHPRPQEWTRMALWIADGLLQALTPQATRMRNALTELWQHLNPAGRIRVTERTIQGLQSDNVDVQLRAIGLLRDFLPSMSAASRTSLLSAARAVSSSEPRVQRGISGLIREAQ